MVGRGDVILAGHGVAKAARKMGIEKVPIVRLDLDPSSPHALKLVAGDNEIGHLAEINDRVLTEMLREIMTEIDLVGTGYDESMLAAYAMVTRPASEIRDTKAAGEWAGLPEYQEGSDPFKLTITFENEEGRREFCKKFGIRISMDHGKTFSTRWPFTENEDPSSLEFRVKK